MKNKLVALFLLTSAIGISASSNISSDAVSKTKSNKEIINQILAEAKIGKIINCKYLLTKAQLDSLINDYGQPDSSSDIPGINGFYYIYIAQNVVFGFNKGVQLFELRSYDLKINNITYSQIIATLGKPDHDVMLSYGQREIGYIASNDFHLEFILKGKEDNSTVHHYNVLYPKGTVNSMSGYAGRDW